MSIESLADKSKDTVFFYEEARKEMKNKGIDISWIITNLKDIAENAMIVTKEGVFPDYRARNKAINDLARMAKMSGSTEGVSSTVKQMMIAQGANGGEGNTFNLTKILYGGGSY